MDQFLSFQKSFGLQKLTLLVLVMCLPICLAICPWPISKAASAQDVRSALMPEKHKATIKQYCYDCHDSSSKEGGINLQELAYDLGNMQTAETWQKVLNVLNSGEMPPPDSAQLTGEQKAEVLEDLSKSIVVARKILSDGGGVITMRRLNRREYRNSIRELLGVSVDVDALPDDSTSDGFDTSGSSLFVSSDQFEQYMKIAQTALDEAIVRVDEPQQVSIRTECETVLNNQIKNRSKKIKKQYEKAQAWRKTKGKKSPTDFGFIDSDRVKFEEGVYRKQYPSLRFYLDMPETKNGAVLVTTFGGATVSTTKFSKAIKPGKYKVRVRAGCFDDSPASQQFLEYGYRVPGQRAGEMNVVGCRKIDGTIESPETIEFEFHVEASAPQHVAFRQRIPNNRDAQQLEFNEARRKRLPAPKPTVWLDWVEIEGPLHNQWPPAAHKKIFFDKSAKPNEEYARKIISRFAFRAFRNKWPAQAYVEKLVKLYRSGRVDGKSFKDALKEPLAVVLSSPSFLYLSEPTETRGAKRELDDRELAIRLSYFLWSAPPDYQLIKLAKDGKLSNPEVLRKQTNRMLADRRAKEFVTGFTHQWLHMERLDFFQFNPVLYPEFDDSVKQAARDEVFYTVRHILNKNLPIGRLLKSDFIVINDLLADYYGFKNVEGSHFRKFPLPENEPSVRGGLLGTAAVMAMGSDGERSSPVERGAWVLRKLLNAPPPPAPPNVPQLNRIEDQLASARTLQKAHQEEPQCAQCHRKIDPIGYGLENFDAAGRWRSKEKTVEISRGRIVKSKTHDVNPSGRMPDGTEFKDFFGLRDELAKRESDFARGFAEAIIGYGLGRPYGFSDHDLATEIVENAAAKDYGMREFIHGVVQSKQFRMK